MSTFEEIEVNSHVTIVSTLARMTQETRVLFVSSGRIYLFDYFNAMCFLISFAFRLHTWFHVYTLVLSHVISAMTTDFLLLLFEKKNCLGNCAPLKKYLSQTK